MYILKYRLISANDDTNGIIYNNIGVSRYDTFVGGIIIYVNYLYIKMGTLNTSNKKYVLLYDKPKAGVTLFQYQFADEH